MATGVTKPGEARADANDASREIVETARFIERQIDKTRTQVRLHDIAAAVLLLTAGTIAFLLAVVLIDHWIAPLGIWGRSVALLVLIVGWGYGCWRQVKPSLVQRINPVYAARAIENGAPGLKNSLINFLLLRSQPGATRSVVLEAVQERAASDLTNVSVETVVDGSRLIRIGYLITVLVALGGLYNLTSPKDPWQTVHRVLAPWGDIARPARVAISDVKINGVAGDDSEPVTVYLGEQAVVTATVRGPRHQEQVSLYYTTSDQQTMDKPITAQPVDTLGNFRCSLPGHAAGLQQDVTFRIEAGDAVSKDYLITVLAVPHIDVDSIHYEFPPYTKREKQIVENQGDIRGLEGTRVSIYASANQEIESAYLHFLGEQHSLASENQRQDLPMLVQGKKVSASFHLTLAHHRPSKQTGSYEIRFVNDNGQRNQRPVQHLIEVTGDLEPHIEVLTPQIFDIKLPEDGKQTIEVLARDPDYGLTLLRLQMVAGGESLLDETLLDDSSGWPGAANRRYVFVPRAFGLRAGQTVKYWALAEDNRADALTSSPKPNRSRTAEYEIKIVAAEHPDRKPTLSAEETPSPHAPHDESTQEENGQKEDDSKQEGLEGSADSDNKQSDSEADAAAGTDEKGDSNGATESPSTDAPSNGTQTRSDQPVRKNDEGNGPPVEGQKQGGTGARESRPNDGSDDGPIFDQLLKHMRQAQGEGPDDNLGEPTPDGVDPAQQNAQQDEKGSSEERATNDGNGSSSSQSPLDGTPDDGNASEATPGEGERTDGHPQPQQQSSQPSRPDDSNHTPQPSSGNSGQSGTGRKNTDDQHSPSSQGTNRPRKKSTARPGEHEDAESAPAKSPSTSPQQSDSESGQTGDGESGDGQPAQQSGKGSPGSNTPADDGTGAAHDVGEGESSGRAGDDEVSAGKTGKPGESKGPNSRSTDDVSGSDKGQDRPSSGIGSGTDSGQALIQDGQQKARDISSPGQQTRQGHPATGGLVGEADTSGSGEVIRGQPTGDDPNLEYAREATDMALRYLKDQQDNPDRALLDELGWTNEDLRKFIQRWDKLHQETGDDQSVRRALKERLKSLGLQPSRNTIRHGKQHNDDFRKLTDPGNRTRPPQNYQEIFEAYQKSTATEGE